MPRASASDACGKDGSLNKAADYGTAAEKKAIAGTANPEVAATYRTGDFGTVR